MAPLDTSVDLTADTSDPVVVDATHDSVGNLRAISGISAKPERVLHKLGITSVRQIADFTADDIRSVSAELSDCFTDHLTRHWVVSGWAAEARELCAQESASSAVQTNVTRQQEQTDAACTAPASSDALLGELLLADDKLSTDALERALRLQREQHADERLGSLLIKLGALSERDVAGCLALQVGLPLRESRDYPDASSVDERVPLRFMQQNHAIVFTGNTNVLVVQSDPLDTYVLESVRFVCGDSVCAEVGIAAEIESFLEQLGTQDSDQETAGGDARSYVEDVEHLRELASEAPVIKTVNNLLQRAAENRASDIHVEPGENRLRIRYRVDGVLCDVDPPPARYTAAIVSRLKLMASLNIAERRLPQDGRIKRLLQGREIDLRVSTVPTSYGESVVLRLLDRGDATMSFSQLGFSDSVRDELLELLSLPHGIVLVTGPTGSGKTTTLYAGLTQLNTAARKLITVEDPVEYNLEGINQIHVKPQIGLTFASALRSIVRQDPDVIMVGEMRDTETARIAVQSALTGHLVLSTLHTNDAASSVTRLLDMDVEDYLLASTLKAVVAQRLVRRICKHCRKPGASTDGIDKRLAQRLKQHLREGRRLFRAVGCERCGGNGYFGRTTIAELLVVDDALRTLMMQGVDAGRIERVAAEQGMQTMFEHGVEKVLAGETTLQEVARVTQDA